MHEQLQAIITVLLLINPAICAAMFARPVAGQSLREKNSPFIEGDVNF